MISFKQLTIAASCLIVGITLSPMVAIAALLTRKQNDNEENEQQ